jgi:hypothetical protein
MTTGRRLRSGSARGIVLASMLLVIGATSLSAHRRDELLQAVRIGVAADRLELEMSLTPGMAVADEVIRAIDRDRNGLLSAEEQDSYSALVMAATEIRIDGRIVNMAAEMSTYPLPAELHDGDRSIELRSAATFPTLSSGRHEIAFTNSYRTDISVYLANALKPDSEQIVIASQRRDPAQRTLVIDFTNDDNRFAAFPAWLFGSGAAAWLVVRRRLLPAPQGTQRA